MIEAVEAWRIRDVDPGSGDQSELARGAGGGWIPATAPGDTYRALIAAGRLADPYAGRNEADAAWVRDREWWWHARVDLGKPAAGETVALVFDCLDTFADVFLDGLLIGRADNMFRRWRFDITGVAQGTHDLALRFLPATVVVAGEPLPVWAAFTDRITRSRRTLMRKAQFGWGWDWAPDLPTVGIGGRAAVERTSGPVVTGVDFSTLAIATDFARVRVDVDVSTGADVAIALLDPNGAMVAGGSLARSGSLELNVPHPRLWWAAGHGGQPLYELVVTLEGVEVYRRRVGIRTIAIDESPDEGEPGTTFFRFVLNGVPIFAKGACWVPASSFTADVPDAVYRALLERAAAANMNMIRVWGGGIYEPDLFYDECDRLGLLVWQDFMFACAPYPGDDPGFVANVRAEVAEQVARLRHHASLAMWCGNNENQAIHWFNDVSQGISTPLIGLELYQDLIPAVLAELDPDTPYRPSSPWGGPTPNSMRGGDVHNWTVWHGIPPVSDAKPDGPYATTPEGAAFTRYAEDNAKFVSEFGLQGAPDMGTLHRWMAPADMTLDSAGILERIKDVADKASAMMIPVTGLPDTLERFVDFTMLAQAEGLKFGIEHYRRRMPHCSGALIWQLNDCWPCVSWSLVDYDLVAKASWYAVARAFAPVLASFRLDGGHAELWVTSDRHEPVSGAATITMALLAGGSAWREDVAFEIAANSSRCVWRAPIEALADRVLAVRSHEGLFPANRLLLAPVKDLALVADPGLNVVVEPRDDGLSCTVSAQRYALAVQVRSDDPTLRFDDNHFDLAGGERRIVQVTRSDGLPVCADAIEVSSFNSRKMK